VRERISIQIHLYLFKKENLDMVRHDKEQHSNGVCACYAPPF